MKNLFTRKFKKTSYTMAVEAKKLEEVLAELKANNRVLKVRDKQLTSGQHVLTITIRYCAG